MIFQFTIWQLNRLKIFLAVVIILLIVLLRLTRTPKHIKQPSKLIKGMWLSHVGKAFLTYITMTDNAFYQLSRLNYNRVYVDIDNNGTAYPSKYSPRNYLLSLPLTNPLKKAIKEGTRQGLKIYEYLYRGTKPSKTSKRNSIANFSSSKIRLWLCNFSLENFFKYTSLE